MAVGPRMVEALELEADEGATFRSVDYLESMLWPKLLGKRT